VASACFLVHLMHPLPNELLWQFPGNILGHRYQTPVPGIISTSNHLSLQIRKKFKFV